MEDQDKLNDLGANLDFAQPWERLPDEPSRQFEWFCCYKLLGPGRSLRAAYRQFQSQKASLGAVSQKSAPLPAAWQNSVVQYDWKARALAYDESQRAEREQEMENRRHDYAEASWSYIEKLHERVDAMLKHPLTEKKLSKTTVSEDGKTTLLEVTVKPAAWRLADVPRLLQVADILARSAMGIEVSELLKEIDLLDEDTLISNADAAIKTRRPSNEKGGED
jgi:hypothetical protein